jgi:Undecaprenyl-phosphate glucose phosphotransferase
MKRSRLLFSVSLAAVDLGMATLAFWLAYRLRLVTDHSSIDTFSKYVPMLFIQVLSIFTVLFFSRMYHRKRALSHMDEFYAVVGTVSVATVTSIAFISFIFKNTLDYHRLMMVYAWLLSIALITMGRIIHARIQWWLQGKGIGEEKVLIVGTGEVGQMILQKINHSPGLGYKVSGFVDMNGGPPSVLDTPVLGKADQIPVIIEKEGIAEVIIALPEATHEDIVTLISMCERGKVGIKVFPDVFQIMAKEVSIGDLGGLPLLTVRDIALRGWKLTLKRGIDIVVSAVSLVILSPLMLITAALIKLDSPGPVFFVQERMGMDAKPFLIYKFRSMRQDAEAHGPGWTKPNDPRRTRLGTIMRRLNIDEFPQLINVLLGDMSMVGPRPEQPAYVEQFRRNIPRYMDRHREKAGITGWAQVNGMRGDTSIAERTKYDLWYIENWSVFLDLRILVRTVFRAFGDRNAY